MAAARRRDPDPRDDALSDLSRRERQLMEALLARGAATVQEVRDMIPDAPSPSAVRTFLSILERKNLVARDRQGRSNVYRPQIAAREAGRNAFRQVLDTFFGGSFEAAITAHLAGAGAALSPEELRSAARLIEDARRHAEDSSPDADTDANAEDGTDATS